MTGDALVAESRSPLLVSETGLPNRLSLEREAGREDAYVVAFGVDRFGVVRNAIGFDQQGRRTRVLDFHRGTRLRFTRFKHLDVARNADDAM